MAYATLLLLQRRSADDPFSMEALSLYSPSLIPLVLSDIHRPDEEIASQALKCLGFMLYHPSLVPTVSEGVARSVLESLVKLIMTTRMKAVCNLGIWCISIQQLGTSFVEFSMDSLLKAVVHALDNPFGSLSTTFEAMQAVMKLATQLGGHMRDMSNIWVPPVYRRLLSTDKRERNMAERCLLKTKSIICPPPLLLSKAVMIDLKQKLLPSMMDAVCDHQQKVHMIQAWGWYICLLGSDTLRDRHLVNKMLKIPEHMFSDPDPQIQIASLVAWECFVDALLPPQIIDLLMKTPQDVIQQTGPTPSASWRHCDVKINCLLKRIKVMMMPLQGIIASKCDISVRSCCLKTWRYLLHKLDLVVNHPSVIEITLWPILKVVFSRGPDHQSIGLWTSCVNLLDEFVLSKVKVGEMAMTVEQHSDNLVNNGTLAGPSIDCKASWKDFPVKWSPWDISNLDLHLEMIGAIVSPELMETVTSENRIQAFNAALKIFRSVLQGVQVELKRLSTPYDRIQICIKTIFKFTKKVCETINLEQNANQLLRIALEFVKVVREELETNILASPLYWVSLDLKYIHDLQCSGTIDYPNISDLGVGSLAYMDMISPIDHTTILYLSVIAQLVREKSDTDGIICAMQHSNILFCTANPLINLHAIVCFLNMHLGKPVHGRLSWLPVWKFIAKGLKKHVDGVNDLSQLTTDGATATYDALYWFLSYPFLILLFPELVFTSRSIGKPSEKQLISSDGELKLESVIEAWKSLFSSCSHAYQILTSSMNNFAEGLCELLVRVLDENISILQDGTESLKVKAQNFVTVSVYGEVVVHMLNHIQLLDVASSESKVSNKGSDNILLKNKGSDNCRQCSSIKNSLRLVGRFLGLSLIFMNANPLVEHEVISRVFTTLASFVRRLVLKQDIHSFLEIISEPLAQWLSFCAFIYGKMQQGNTICQLHRFWAQTLDCLQRSQPSIVFDSFFLKDQASLLQTALDHPHPPISDSSIAFWNATYGQNGYVQYHHCLLPVLNKLSRSGRINLSMNSQVNFGKNGCLLKEPRDASQRYGEPMLQKRNTGLDNTEDPENDNGHVDIETMGLRRKRLKMSQHQKKPGGHQGRVQGIRGLGPGVDVGFGQKSKHPHGKKELRKLEHILEMLKRAS
ncbi:Telomere-associated protein RIF1 [Cocos nucifera]|uniref:Telomere-associated protein RIF1 n=1 Tax=Cocos nucifera TaxID=13894 RepID=A0A8K0HWK1_COCNU|nr:Telomere-associated protein RIF1 [Cocos nucifera]